MLNATEYLSVKLRMRGTNILWQIKNELPPLEEGIEQIYTPPTTPTGTGNHEDRKLILKRFAKSLLLNFLELVGTMSIHPEQV